MSENKNFIYLIILGDSNRGKNFASISQFFQKNFEKNEKLYQIEIWDVSGLEKYKKLLKRFAKGAFGSILLCDATIKQSRED